MLSAGSARAPGHDVKHQVVKSAIACQVDRPVVPSPIGPMMSYCLSLALRSDIMGNQFAFTNHHVDHRLHDEVKQVFQEDHFPVQDVSRIMQVAEHAQSQVSAGCPTANTTATHTSKDIKPLLPYRDGQRLRRAVSQDACRGSNALPGMLMRRSCRAYA